MEILDSGMLLSIMIAFSAGILSFISPCVLPVVPPYLAFISGVSFSEMKSEEGNRNQVIYSALFFFLGLSFVFLVLGFTVSTLGRVFLQNQVLFGRIAGGIIILFGFHFLGLFRIPILDQEFRFGLAKKGGKSLSAFILGLAFAFGWVPCIGPQLGAILTLAAQESSVSRGTFLLGIYALGLGLPFVIAAFFINRFIAFSNRMKKHFRLIEIIIGVILIAVGGLLVTNRFSVIAYWLLENVPWLAVVG